MKKYILFVCFGLMVIAQWFMPVQMIFGKEKIIRQGKEFRFLTRPYDPYDAFRGKYIDLAFEQTSIRVKDFTADYGENVYAIIGKDSSGFAILTDVTREIPTATTDFIKVKVSYAYPDSNGVSAVNIYYPFDRFYMEESKASFADAAYLEASRDTSMVTYAIVHVLNGDAVIRDVYIDGVPIAEVARKRQMEEE